MSGIIGILIYAQQGVHAVLTFWVTVQRGRQITLNSEPDLWGMFSTEIFSVLNKGGTPP